MRVGVVGYSSGKFDRHKAKVIVGAALEALYKRTKGNMSIVSGLTDLGIPALAYQFAKEKKLPTVGIACAKATEYDCFPCDKKIIVGEDWGDESQTFLSSIDYLVRVGGGSQSLDEVKKFKKLNGDDCVEEYELERLD